ncbi:Protein of unknown function [Lactobacillus acidophilus DSM 9126]|nr:Protein of unknown function [Lactobacillus acidophilus DSM 20079 = JCM 1132 = NBRC 13951 = CIP 76.13]CDF69557.1 Protein of unknown function [Lactobacillus acidophilus CIRM-BIA 442]CDF71353.1 Protein of unknown function [Lactobacillus acidophilus CIRM-BIA 445]CDF73183.1 Protein of unknown function [Lactobacillus acidophilus DSM 9126]CDF75172.1 Protein of unknown function [Lactobacillus acidophilus DSM 20242]
MVELSG